MAEADTVPTLASATAALAALLGQKQAAGVYFTPTGAPTPVLFPTASAAQSLVAWAWNALTATPVLAADGDIYLAADGTPIALSMADARVMIQKALAYFKFCNIAYARLYAAVAANPATDITVGWPANT